MRILESISEFFVGLDLGQKRDFSAFCLVERRVEMFDAKDPVTWNFLRRTRFHLRHLGRVPLGTPLICGCGSGSGADGDDDAESSVARAV